MLIAECYGFGETIVSHLSEGPLLSHRALSESNGLLTPAYSATSRYVGFAPLIPLLRVNCNFAW